MTKWNGSKLTQARDERVWSRGEFAEAWYRKYRRRLSLVSISNWERGIKPPGRNNLIKLAALFEVPVEYFFTIQVKKKSIKKKRSKKRFGIF